jgi:hypothetical protein
MYCFGNRNTSQPGGSSKFLVGTTVYFEIESAAENLDFMVEGWP